MHSSQGSQTQWILGSEQHKDIFPHMQHAGECGCTQDGGNECLTACVQYQGLCLVSTDPGWAPAHAAHSAPGCWAAKQLLLDTEPAPPFQTRTRSGGYSRAMGQGHPIAGTGIWNTCLWGAIWRWNINTWGFPALQVCSAGRASTEPSG